MRLNKWMRIGIVLSIACAIYEYQSSMNPLAHSVDYVKHRIYESCARTQPLDIDACRAAQDRSLGFDKYEIIQ